MQHSAYHQLQDLDVATAREDQVLGDAALHLASNEAGDAGNVVAVLDHPPSYLQAILHSMTQYDHTSFATDADVSEGTRLTATALPSATNTICHLLHGPAPAADSSRSSVCCIPKP